MKNKLDTFIVDEATEERIDIFLAKRYKEYSRSYFQELIEKEQVLLNGNPLKKREVPSIGDQILVHFKNRPGPDLSPQAISLDILYEDAHLIAINKPVNMVVHPAPGNWSNTFVNALLNHCSLPETSDVRPGIVHRLDKETSGVLIAAKTDLAHQKLSELFASRQMQKEYVAIVIGKVVSQTINLPIKRCPIHRKKMIVCPDEGKEALTEVELLGFNGNLSKLLLKPKTGRTHQIRVHLKHLGNPVLGDKLYGKASINERYKADRHYLHAKKLSFTHPITGKLLTLEAPLPKEMEEMFLCGY